ncbi:MAG: class I SAM-dependent methyltransferase [Acidobacteriota bacterium]
MTDATDTRFAEAGLRDGYDREAAHYDQRRYQSARGRFFSNLEQKILRAWLSLTPGSLVLDMPAGTGRLSHSLAKPGITVVGVDISENMLRRAAAKRTPNDGPLLLAQGSGTALPFPDNTFDAVACFKFFHLIPNDHKAPFMRELTRVLKPGKPLVVEFNSPFYGVALAWIRYYFRKKQPGGMRMKCLFPDQVATLFEGLEVVRTQGVKLPLASVLGSLIGVTAAESLNVWVGGLPAVKYLTYAIMIEARKPVPYEQQ